MSVRSRTRAMVSGEITNGPSRGSLPRRGDSDETPTPKSQTGSAPSVVRGPAGLRRGRHGVAERGVADAARLVDARAEGLRGRGLRSGQAAAAVAGVGVGRAHRLLRLRGAFFGARTAAARHRERRTDHDREETDLAHSDLHLLGGRHCNRLATRIRREIRPSCAICATRNRPGRATGVAQVAQWGGRRPRGAAWVAGDSRALSASCLLRR